jgi:hypothetical protein
MFHCYCCYITKPDQKQNKIIIKKRSDIYNFFLLLSKNKKDENLKASVDDYLINNTSKSDIYELFKFSQILEYVKSSDNDYDYYDEIIEKIYRQIIILNLGNNPNQQQKYKCEKNKIITPIAPKNLFFECQCYQNKLDFVFDQYDIDQIGPNIINNNFNFDHLEIYLNFQQLLKFFLNMIKLYYDFDCCNNKNNNQYNFDWIRSKLIENHDILQKYLNIDKKNIVTFLQLNIYSPHDILKSSLNINVPDTFQFYFVDDENQPNSNINILKIGLEYLKDLLNYNYNQDHNTDISKFLKPFMIKSNDKIFIHLTDIDLKSYRFYHDDHNDHYDQIKIYEEYNTLRLEYDLVDVVLYFMWEVGYDYEKCYFLKNNTNLFINPENRNKLSKSFFLMLHILITIRNSLQNISHLITIFEYLPWANLILTN